MIKSTKESLTLHFDGACEPRNPGGVATGGWLIEDEVGEVLHEGSAVFCEGFGATNNIAEYHSLGHGLRWLSDQVELTFPRRVVIRGDSQLVINQIIGAWRCNKPHLEKLRDRCRQLINAIEDRGAEVTLEWVPREDNELADMLSRQAYEKHTGKPFPVRRKR